MTKALRIGIAGLGTVGGGVIKILNDNASLLTPRCGRAIEVVGVSARNRNRDRGVDLSSYQWFDNPVEMASCDDIDVIVELIGGSDGTAKALCEAALKAGKHVVTANKALLAHHGKALAELAEANGVSLNFEAAVAGGIPIIKALREGLAGNKVVRLYGILNGTCNYILTAMRETGREFADILAEAQDLGYAEADPSFDVDGIDAAHKLSILTSLAYGCEIDFERVQVEGIRHISPVDIEFAEELGFRIKLLGVTTLCENGVEQRVQPCMVSKKSSISRVEGVFNAVVVEGNFVQNAMFEGRGAGEGPTASAVVGDLADIARGIKLPTFGVAVKDLVQYDSVAISQHKGAYYIRLMVLDEPGVFAEIAGALRDNHVSMESVIQRTRAPGEAVPVVVTTHDTDETAILNALDSISRIRAVVEQPRVIRIESF